jgi:Holliday junction resolvase RusA-like endonuclease
MAKRPLKLRVRIPQYRAPRNAWRRDLNAAAWEAKDHAGVTYRDTDRLEIHVRLYLKSDALTAHDVDNRLKDILDALQGRAGGPKTEHRLRPIIPNDKQVYRVIIEKEAPPKQSRGLGHLLVRRL